LFLKTRQKPYNPKKQPNMMKRGLWILTILVIVLFLILCILYSDNLYLSPKIQPTEQSLEMINPPMDVFWNPEINQLYREVYGVDIPLGQPPVSPTRCSGITVICNEPCSRATFNLKFCILYICKRHADILGVPCDGRIPAEDIAWFLNLLGEPDKPNYSYIFGACMLKHEFTHIDQCQSTDCLARRACDLETEAHEAQKDCIDFAINKFCSGGLGSYFYPCPALEREQERLEKMVNFQKCLCSSPSMTETVCKDCMKILGEISLDYSQDVCISYCKDYLGGGIECDFLFPSLKRFKVKPDTSATTEPDTSATTEPDGEGTVCCL